MSARTHHRPAGRIIGEHFRSDGRPKLAHPSREQAEARMLNNQYPYQCSFCGLWHLGSNARPRPLP